MIVSKADLKELTGYTRVSAQIRWLRRNGWRFTVNGLGDPIVAIAEFNRQMVGGKATPATQEPNFEGINDVRSPAKTQRDKVIVAPNR